MSLYNPITAVGLQIMASKNADGVSWGPGTAEAAIRMDAGTASSGVETTPDHLKFGIDATSQRLIVCGYDDIGINTTLGNATHPTLSVASNGADKFLHLSHNDTDTIINSSSGDIILQSVGVQVAHFSTAGIVIQDDDSYALGASSDALLKYDTATETTDSLKLFLPTANPGIRLMNVDDVAVNTTIGAASAPQLMMFDDGASDFMYCQHNGTNFRFATNNSAHELIFAPGDTNTMVIFHSDDVGGDCLVKVTGDSDCAVPVLFLDQNDTDQQFIEFEGTETANAASSLSSWTTGATIQGFIRISVNGTDEWIPRYTAPTS